jgi:predicted nucleic acid-binding Zn ribbon protein
METIRCALETAVRSLKELPAEQRTMLAWAIAAGPLIAGHSRVAAFRPGALEIEVEDERWRRQLAPMNEDLIGRLRELLGADAPRRLAFKTPGDGRTSGHRTSGARTPRATLEANNGPDTPQRAAGTPSPAKRARKRMTK